MTRMELVVWKKRRKHGKQILMPSIKEAKKRLKKEKKHPEFKGYTLIQIRSEYYKKHKLKRVM